MQNKRNQVNVDWLINPRANGHLHLDQVNKKK